MSKPERQCGVPWGVCESCLGQGLTRSGERCWCEKCGRTYPLERYEGACPLPAAVLLEDSDGTLAPVCASHAAHPRVTTWRKKPLGPKT